MSKAKDVKWRKWLEPWATNTADSYVVVKDTTLKIADCGRTVSLEFYVNRRYRTRAQALKKIQTLREALDRLEDNVRAQEGNHSW